MRGKVMFLAGAAAGYVLGARAGRERYEQIRSQADSLWNSPKVQDTVSTVGQTVKDKTPDVQAKVSEAAGQAAGAARAKASDVAQGAQAKVSRDSQNDSGLIGSESGSDYTPHDTPFNSAD